MNISPRQLRIFVFLAQSLNFRRTADRFFLTQPTLSKLVRDLEQTLGVRLFERNTRSVRITADGEALLRVARRIVDDFDGGLVELEQVVRYRARRLSIAALPTLAATLLPEAIAAFQRETPDALVRVHDVITDEVLDLLRARQVDMALTTVDVMHKDLACTEIFREPFVLLCASGRQPRLAQWSAAGIAGLPVIAMSRGTGTRRLIEAALMREGVTFRPLLELRDLNAIGGFVREGCGMALLPRSAARLICTANHAVHEMRGAPQRTVGVVTRRDTEPSPLARRLVRTIRQHAAARGMSGDEVSGVGRY